MVKILISGATGYIGGDGLYALAHAHPEWEITCTARNSDKGAVIASQYPKVRLAYGDLDAHDMLVEEASRADIVLHFANCDHEVSARAIIEGLSKRESPSYLIHTSGTGVLTIDDVHRGAFGQPFEKVYDDWDGINEVTSLPPDAWHRNVDTIVLAANGASGGKVHTAIVCPPTIYGPGRGPGNVRSDQVYKMAEAVLKRGKGFLVGDGQNRWTDVHVHDLSDLFLKLAEAAAQGGGKATWDEQGYYFAEHNEFAWGEYQRAIAVEAHKQGLLDTADLDKLSFDEANEVIPNGGKRWGYNSRCRAVRGRKLLGWSPQGESVLGLLPSIVKQEAEALGLVKRHAQIAAGE